MLGTPKLLVANGEFTVGYARQTQWNWLIATAFLLGKVGGGLFLVSLLVRFPLGMLVGWLVVVVGKSAAHIAFLGRPQRFWRAFARPRTSWLSRGLWAMVAFAITGLLTMSPLFSGFNWLPLAPDTLPWTAVMVIAVLSALMMMVYDGFVMAASPSMAFWNTPLLPVLAFSYALLGGVTFTIVLGFWTGSLPDIWYLEVAELTLFVLNFLIVGSYVLTMFSSAEPAKRAAQVLIRLHTIPFLVGVVVVGLMASALLVLWFTATSSAYVLIGVAAADMLGHYLLFYLLLRAGLFAPVSIRRSRA